MNYPAIIIPDRLEVALVPTSSGLARKVNQIVDLNGGHNQSHLQMRGAGGIAKVNDLGLMSLIGNTRSLVLSGEATSADDSQTRENHARLDTAMIRALGAQIVNAGPVLEAVIELTAYKDTLPTPEHIQKMAVILASVKSILDLAQVTALPEATAAIDARLETLFETLFAEINQQSPQLKLEFLPVIRAIFETIEPIASAHGLDHIAVRMDDIIQKIEDIKIEATASILALDVNAPINIAARIDPVIQPSTPSTENLELVERVVPNGEIKPDAQVERQDKNLASPDLPAPSDAPLETKKFIDPVLSEPSSNDSIAPLILQSEATNIAETITPHNNFSAIIDVKAPVNDSFITPKESINVGNKILIPPSAPLSSSIPILMNRMSVAPQPSPQSPLQPQIQQAKISQQAPAPITKSAIPTLQVKIANIPSRLAVPVAPAMPIDKVISNPHAIPTIKMAMARIQTASLLSKPVIKPLGVVPVAAAPKPLIATTSALPQAPKSVPMPSPLLKQVQQNFTKTIDAIRTIQAVPPSTLAPQIKIPASVNNNSPERGAIPTRSPAIPMLRQQFTERTSSFIDVVKLKSSELFYKIKNNSDVQIACQKCGGICRCARDFTKASNQLAQTLLKKNISHDEFVKDEKRQAALGKTIDTIIPTDSRDKISNNHARDLMRTVENLEKTRTTNKPVDKIILNNPPKISEAASNEAPKSLRALRAARNQNPNPV